MFPLLSPQRRMSQDQLEHWHHIQRKIARHVVAGQRFCRNIPGIALYYKYMHNILFILVYSWDSVCCLFFLQLNNDHNFSNMHICYLKMCNCIIFSYRQLGYSCCAMCLLHSFQNVYSFSLKDLYI